MSDKIGYEHVFIKNRTFLVENIDVTRTKLGEKLVEKRLISAEQLEYIQVLFYLILLFFRGIRINVCIKEKFIFKVHLFDFIYNMYVL